MNKNKIEHENYSAERRQLELLAGALDLAQRYGITTGLIVELAKKIAPNANDTSQALRELEEAVTIAARLLRNGRERSHLDAFASDTLEEVSQLTESGDLDGAALLARERLAAAKVPVAALRNAAIESALLTQDAQAAANLILQRITEDTSGPTARFDSLQKEQAIWYQRGRDKGLALDLRVAVHLAESEVQIATDQVQRNMALINLGITLQTLGEREPGTVRLEHALSAFHAAQGEVDRDRAPLAWATSQMNLGNTLRMLGEREPGNARLEEAVAAYRSALTEFTRERAPMQWASTLASLSTALHTLGKRETGSARLEESVATMQEVLRERTRDRVPLDWAMTWNNLGNALQTLGARETGTARLEEAVAAYRDALKERTRDRVPLDWAMTWSNLGNALQTLGARETGTARLEEAVDAYRAALQELTRDRVPLDWAKTQTNLARAIAEIARRTDGDFSQALAAIDGALEVFRDSGATAHIDNAEAIRRSLTGENPA